MARHQTRHLVEKPGAMGPRWFWQPSEKLRAQGWRQHRLPASTLAEAMALAEAHNAELDAWRIAQGAGAPKKRHATGSVAAMIAAYQASKWWPAGARTQKDYRLYLKQIADWAGDQPARAITAVAVQAFHDAMARRTEGRGRTRRIITTPARAAAAVRVLSALLSAGKRLGFVDTNTALRAGIRTERQREPVLWTRAQLDHLVATADAMGWHSQGTAMVLNFWCGQRQADILALPPYRIEQGAIVLKQGKTGRRVSLPVHLVPELVARLEAQRSRPNTLASTTHLLLHEGTGEAWRSFTFTHTFAEIRAKAAAGDAKLKIAAMPDVAALQWMELRHTAVTNLKAAGQDALSIAGITGHTAQSVQAILDKHYLIRTAAAAEEAFKARLEREGGACAAIASSEWRETVSALHDTPGTRAIGVPVPHHQSADGVSVFRPGVDHHRAARPAMACAAPASQHEPGRDQRLGAGLPLALARQAAGAARQAAGGAGAGQDEQRAGRIPGRRLPRHHQPLRHPPRETGMPGLIRSPIV